MAAEDEEKPKKLQGYVLGQPIDAMSVAEFDASISELRREIERLEAARGRKVAAQAAAASYFKS